MAQSVLDARDDGTRPDRHHRLGEKVAAAVARFGLAARTVFYLLLVYLVIQLALDGGGGKQANAHGALVTVASQPAGLVAIIATAVGFVGFGFARIWGSIRDDGPSTWRRITTFLQGAFYVVLAWIPFSFAMGHRSTGSEMQQHRTAQGLLHLPAGRELVFGVGLVAIGVCLNQIRTGVDQAYAYGMRTSGSPPWVRRLVRTSGTIGIPARAVVFFPIGIFFMVAAVQGDPRHADGLDRELGLLTRHAWGDAILAAVALGLLIFAVYSGLEARYRTVTKGK